MKLILDIDSEIERRGIPQSWQGTYRRAQAGSRPAAVKCFCGECQGYEDGARQAIRDCTDIGCPIYAVRPFQKKAGKEIDIDTDTGDETSEEPGNPSEELRKPAGITFADVKAKILDHLRRHGESQRGYIIFSTGIPESMWSEAIRTLLVDGEVERDGEKRNTRYRLKESAK